MSVDWEPGPSDSLKTFGAFVQALREHHGHTREQFAPLVRFSVHTVASIELGRRTADEVFVERADRVLGDTGALLRAAKHLSRQPGWASWVRKWARPEGQAVSLSTYECRLVPGLLQSEPYVRAVFGESIPPLADEQLEAQVTARRERQRLCRELPNTSFSFIIEEAVLRRELGRPEVSRGMLDHLLEHVRLPNVVVQVMPLNSRHHACLDGPLQLVELPDGRRHAYAEGQKCGRLISDVKEVSVLCQRYATQRSQAFSPADSEGLLERLRGA